MSEPKILLELYFIRHGESLTNAGLIDEYADPESTEDPILSKKGFEQARAMGKYLRFVNFDAVYSSALKRAMLTAGALIDEQGKQQELLIHPLLSEINVKEPYGGMTPAELPLYVRTAVPAPGVDIDSPLVINQSDDDEAAVLARADEMLFYFYSRYKNGEKVAVVSHGGFITYMLFHIMEFRKKCPGFDITLSNCGVSLVKFFEPGTNPYGDVSIEFINRMPEIE